MKKSELTPNQSQELKRLNDIFLLLVQSDNFINSSPRVRDFLLAAASNLVKAMDSLSTEFFVSNIENKY